MHTSLNLTDIYLFTTYILHDLQDNTEYNSKTLIVDFFCRNLVWASIPYMLSHFG